MAQVTGQNLPPPQEPFVDPGTGILSYSGYQYLLALLNEAETSQSTASVNTGLVSKGTNQATALQLSSQWNQVDTVSSGTGVLLSAYQPGQSQVVFNNDPVNALLVYPAPGSQINTLGTNVAYSLAAGSRITFEFFTADQVWS